MILLPLRVNIKWLSNHSHRKQYCGIMYIRFRNTWFQFYFIYYKVTKEHFTICTWVIKRNRTNNSFVSPTFCPLFFLFILYTYSFILLYIYISTVFYKIILFYNVWFLSKFFSSGQSLVSRTDLYNFRSPIHVPCTKLRFDICNIPP